MQEWLDKLPKWDKKLAEKLAPLTPYIQAILIITAIFLIYAALTWEPHYQVLLWAYLIAP